MELDLSIIIINYNTYDLVFDCVKSILKETHAITFEVIIVDNASKQRSIEQIINLDDNIRLINSSENLGFGRANNLGMLHAKGNHFLLLNSDTIIIDNGIEKCYSFYLEEVKCGLLGCKELDIDYKVGLPSSFYLEKHTIFNYFLRMPLFQVFRLKSKDGEMKMSAKDYRANSISGAFMFFGRSIFEATKGFDPDFFMYYEETEWCRRIRKEFPIFYNDEIAFIHLKGKSASPDIMVRQMHLSSGLFWYKESLLSYFMFLIISYFIYLPFWFLLWVFSSKKSSKIHYMKYIRIYLSLFKYYTSSVLKYSNRFGARDQMLKLREL